MSVSLSAVQATIAQAQRLHPQDRTRIERAATLIMLGHVEQLDASTYAVRSQTHDGVVYTVHPDACTCEARRRYPTRRCSHEWGVRILLAAEMAQQLESQQDGRQRAAADTTALAYAAAYRPAA